VSTGPGRARRVSTGAAESGPGQHGAADGHAGHGHRIDAEADRGWLIRALLLIAAFMVAEVIVGLTAHSLALLSDAAHMLTDAGAILLALVTMRLAARPPSGGFTYGLQRAEILSAQANGITLLLLSAWLTYGSVRHLIAPPHVAGGLMLITALAGVAVNLGATWMVSRASWTSLNVKGVAKHIVTDLYAFIATAIAAVIIVTTGFGRADAIASLVVVALMVKAGVELVLESGRVFLEAAPAGLQPDQIGQAMAGRPDVAEVHDLHVWQITTGIPAASAHVLVAPGRDCHAVRSDLERLLAGTYQISHTTLQVDHVPDDVLTIPAYGAGPGQPECDPHCGDPHGPVHRSPET
jgi:cobalt-zinc-cadmium efflux system protein